MLGYILFLVVWGLCLYIPRQQNKALFIGALIGGAFSLLGGAKDRKAQKQANAANAPEAQVAAWERAGINPAFGISSGGFIPQRAASIGDSFSQAGALFGQGIDQHRAEKLEQTQTKQENRKLRGELDKLARRSEPSHLRSYREKLPLRTVKEPGENTNPALNNVILTEPGNLKFEGEVDRLDVDKGGSTRDSSVYEISTPVGTWNTDNPMWGERTEGYLGDIFSIPTIVPQIGKDLWKNSNNQYFDANQSKWRKRPSGFQLEPKGTSRATLNPTPEQLAERRRTRYKNIRNDTRRMTLKIHGE